MGNRKNVGNMKKAAAPNEAAALIVQPSLLLRLFADIGKDTAVNIKNVTVDEV